jgi:3-oxoadipate enol-lactonase
MTGTFLRTDRPPRLPLLAPIVGGSTPQPWVTFVPGIGNDVHFWQRQAETLERTHRTLRFDPWGCGESEAPPDHFTIDDVADGIVELWDRMGIERSSVVGLGFGGSVSINVALRHPARVERVAACCCRVRQPKDRRDFWRRRQQASGHAFSEIADQTVARWLGAFGTEHPEIATTLREGFLRNSVDGYRGYLEAFIGMDLRHRLHELTIPVLLVAAENDHGGGPVEAMRRLASEIASSRLAFVPGSGHILTHESPTELSRILSGFL